MKSGVIYVSRPNLRERMNRISLELRRFFYIVGLYGLTLFSGTVSGLVVAFAVDIFYRATGVYESYPDHDLPGYANAMTNLFVRLPLWFFGTLILTGLLLRFHPVRGFLKELWLFFVYVVSYFAIIFGSLIFWSVFRLPDMYFSGSSALVVLPSLVLLLTTMVNPFSTRRVSPINDKLWIIIGLIIFLTPFFYLMSVLCFLIAS